MPDAMHGGFRLLTQRAIIRRQGRGELVRRLEGRERNLLLVAPGIVITGSPLPEPAVERADESAEWVADEEHEVLTDRDVRHREGMPAEDQPIASSRRMFDEHVIESGAARLTDVQHVQRFARVLHLSVLEAS
jgi:hypothetical protein